ncbi:MAG TPA: HAD-IC family P-type ATPase, partial [Myxococcaceae bacterium]|nr:HAD-IC family P-type ATPase [Myxococcaceae bacterium]
MTTTLSVPEMADAHRREVNEVAVALGTDIERGLSGGDAGERLERYGPNELAKTKPVPRWRRFVAQFRDVLVILLVVAAAISVGLWAYERDTGLPYEALAILAVVLLNAVLGYVQEARAESALTSLRAMSAQEATVIRDGERRRVPAAELVPGDLLLVEEGDTIPADARLTASVALQTAEAALTGESLPVSKDVAPVLGEEVALGDRHDMLFSGTAVTYGRGRAIVTATGMRTEMGRIAGLLEQTHEEITPLQRELNRTGRLLGLIVVVIAIAMIATILVVEDVHGFAAVISVLILGVALAVAA